MSDVVEQAEVQDRINREIRREQEAKAIKETLVELTKLITGDIDPTKYFGNFAHYQEVRDYPWDQAHIQKNFDTALGKALKENGLTAIEGFKIESELLASMTKEEAVLQIDNTIDTLRYMP